MTAPPDESREFLSSPPGGHFSFNQFMYLLHWVFVEACRTFQLRYVGSSSLTRDRTQALCIGSTKS